MVLPLLGAILGGVGALAQASAASKAARAQQAATNKQLALQERIYNEQSANFAPGVQSYKNTLAGLQAEITGSPGAGYVRNPDGTVSTAGANGQQVYAGYQKTPYYDTLQRNALNAIDASAASRGSLFSGATLKAQQDRAAEIANAGYGEHMQRLFSLAGMGQNAVAGQGAAAQSYGVNAGNIYGNQGDISAAASIARGNALAGFGNNMAGLLAYQQANNGGQGAFGRNGLFGGGSWS